MSRTPFETLEFYVTGAETYVEAMRIAVEDYLKELTYNMKQEPDSCNFTRLSACLEMLKYLGLIDFSEYCYRMESLKDLYDSEQEKAVGYGE